MPDDLEIKKAELHQMYLTQYQRYDDVISVGPLVQGPTESSMSESLETLYSDDSDTEGTERVVHDLFLRYWSSGRVGLARFKTWGCPLKFWRTQSEILQSGILRLPNSFDFLVSQSPHIDTTKVRLQC